MILYFLYLFRLQCHVLQGGKPVVRLVTNYNTTAHLDIHSMVSCVLSTSKGITCYSNNSFIL